MSGRPPILELADVHARHGQLEVLRGIDLVVPGGGVLTLFGPNGGGKSTILRVVAGLHPVHTGTVRFAGRAVNGWPAEELARCGVCLVPERRGVFPNLTVGENLWMMSYSGATRRQVEEIAYTRFPVLRERRRQLAGTLSGGEQQMLALARAIATDPAVLLLDELSTGLAPAIAADLYEAVATVAAGGVTVLLAERFVRPAPGPGERAALVRQGRIVRVGMAAALPGELSTAMLGE